MDSNKLARFLRAVMAGDLHFEAPSHKTSSGVALFLAGMGAGVVLGMLFAPLSGEQLRTEVSDRTRAGIGKVKAQAKEFASRQMSPAGDLPTQAEKNAS